jgi:hypothetical protein
LSMEDPSTIRRAVADIEWCSLWRGFASGTNDRNGDSAIVKTVPHLFRVRNMFFSDRG